jgi:FkbM family methyltransferase
VSLEGVTARLSIDDENDVIQRYISKGRFYESEELILLNTKLTNNEVIIDVGANIGNHSIYLGYLSSVKVVYPVEPFRQAIDILLRNIQLNPKSKIRNNFIGLAFSDEPKLMRSFNRQLNNIGGTRFIVDADGDVNAIRPDPLLQALDVRPTLVKIDVEGSELAVLKGLDSTISNLHPKLLIEVADRHAEEVLRWIEARNYKVTWKNRRYKSNENWFCE